MSIALHYSYRKIDHEAFCNQDEIPEESVEQVYLKACDLVQFPDWLMRLKNLTHINISCNAVNFVPSDIGSLTNLNYCDMSDNRLVHLTPSLFDLTNLKYLDVAGNFIEEIPTAIRKLKNLELINFDRNFITKIPEELTECINLFQFSFEDCPCLFSVPRNLLMMPNLVNASFRGCNLITLPSMLSSSLTNLLLGGNQLLNCIPHEISKLLPLNLSTCDFYIVDNQNLERLLAAQTEFIEGSPEINHINLPNGTIASMPKEIEQIYTTSSPSITSLEELCYRTVKFNTNIDLTQIHQHIPRHLVQVLTHPTAICTCQTAIFRETFAIFFHEKRRPSNFQLAFVRFFCSKKCLNLFYSHNKEELLVIA